MKKSIVIGLIVIMLISILGIYFYISSSKLSYDELVKNPYLCNTDSDCHIVTVYNSHPIVETLIACRNKNIPLDNETESIKDYNEYTKSRCICDNGTCNFK